jgi:hypothetical protein
MVYTAEYVWNISWLIIKEFINDNTHSQGKGKNKESLPKFLGFWTNHNANNFLLEHMHLFPARQITSTYHQKNFLFHYGVKIEEANCFESFNVAKLT